MEEGGVEVSLGAGLGDSGYGGGYGGGYGSGGGAASRALQVALPAQLGMDPEELQRIRCGAAGAGDGCRGVGLLRGAPLARGCATLPRLARAVAPPALRLAHLRLPQPRNPAGTACTPAASSSGSRPPSSAASWLSAARRLRRAASRQRCAPPRHPLR